MDIVKHIDTINVERKINLAIEQLSLEWIPFDNLWVTPHQVKTFDIAHVNEILENYHPALLRSSSVARIGDKNILWDGQHSATANWISGMDSVPCLVYKCDNMDFKSVPSIEKFDTAQLAELMLSLITEHSLTSIQQLASFIKIPDNFKNR
jgi:hypothetical protein